MEEQNRMVSAHQSNSRCPHRSSWLGPLLTMVVIMTAMLMMATMAMMLIVKTMMALWMTLMRKMLTNLIHVVQHKSSSQKFLNNLMEWLGKEKIGAE